MPIAVRLGLYYAALFIGNGAGAPYIGVWFKAHGMTGAQIGVILSAPALARMLTGPALAIWADGFGRRRSPLILIGAAVAVAYAGLLLFKGFWPWFALWFISQSLFSALSPLADVITLRRARKEGFNYGWPRGMGSAGYIVGNVGMGVVLTLTAPDAVVVWVVVAAVLVTIGARVLLPPDPVHEAGETVARIDRLKGLGELLRSPMFMLALISSGLIQASHGFYYSFSALVWKGQGMDSSLTGLLWGLGVAVEVVFLWFMEPWRRRIGPERLLILGGLAATVRWTCLALSPPLWVVVAVQALHALTFTASFIASLQLIERLSHARSASAAQTLNSALSSGLLIGAATMVSGVLFDRVGALGYLAMSLIAFVGLLGALWLAVLQRRQNATSARHGA